MGRQASSLVAFLQDDLALSSDAIALGLRQADTAPERLPMILWQYGLVSLEELDQIFDWLDSRG